jgi:putative transposase
MVASPAEYRWSSHRANAWAVVDKLIRPHPVYCHLGESEAARTAAYRDLFRSSISGDEMCIIRDATQNAWALGSAAFREKIAALSRRGERLPLGRPRKECRN